MLLGALVVLGAAGILAAPLPEPGRIAVSPGFEASSHLWGLYAAWSEGQPYLVRTTLLGWPDGVTFVLVDPIHLPAFALGHAMGGAGLAWSLMRVQGLLLGALAGAVLGRELRAPVLLAALAAMLAPPLRATGLDGISEDLAVGLPALVLGLSLRLARRRTGGDLLFLALAMAATAHAGPYNTLLGAAGFGLVLAWGEPAGPTEPRTPAARAARARSPRAWLLLAATLALPASLPPMLAVAFGREGDLPGQAARAGIPAFDSGPERFRGGLMHGVDLLDLALPLPLTGGRLEVHHSGYLGLVALVAALLALRRRPALWPLMAGVLGLVGLSLGPWLSLGGRPVEVFGQMLPGPAGLLMEAVPPLGRLQRWYRAAALASLLLAPLAARLASHVGRGGSLALGLALLLDSALLSPVSWPAPSTRLPDPALATTLDALPAGALLELPLSTSGSPGPGQWRDVGPLAQLRHGRPLAGTLMGLPIPERARRAQRAVLDLARDARLPRALAASLRASGYAVLLWRVDRLPMPGGGLEKLRACLGEERARDPEGVIFLLDGLAEACVGPAEGPSARPPSLREGNLDAGLGVQGERR